MQVIIIPCSFDNYSYLVVCEKTGEAAVIDPTESFPVMRQVEEREINLTTVLCTHHHNDHVGDIGQLIQEFSYLRVYCHRSDKSKIPHANFFVEDGDSIQVGELAGRVIHTPGHTVGSICYHFEDVVFTGDTLFGAGCGRLFEGSPEQMYTSVNKKIALLPDETKLFFGHEYTTKNLEFALSVEPQNSDIGVRLQNLQDSDGVSTPTTIRFEKETNPFFRCDSEDIRNNLKLRGVKNVQVGEPLQVFTALREMRNSF